MDRRKFVAFLAALPATLTGCKPPQPVGPVAFGYKMSWLTVRSESIQQVVESFGVLRPKPANWQEGIDWAYQLKGVFVAPPLDGWIAVVGFCPEDFVNPHPDPLSIDTRRIKSASKLFHVSCSFATHRVTEYHHWIRAEEGRVTRCFAYLGERGEVLCNDGAVTPGEQTLSFAKLPPDQWQPDQSDVMHVARVWSYDPSKLTSSSGRASLGVIGTLQ